MGEGVGGATMAEPPPAKTYPQKGSKLGQRSDGRIELAGELVVHGQHQVLFAREVAIAQAGRAVDGGGCETLLTNGTRSRPYAQVCEKWYSLRRIPGATGKTIKAQTYDFEQSNFS